MSRYVPVIIRRPNVPADMRIRLTENNTGSAASAGFPARPGIFKEPDSGLPLKCDMCEDDPPIEEPMCVQVCPHDALTYEEREEEGEEEVTREELEIGLEALAKKHGVQKVKDAIARMSKKN